MNTVLDKSLSDLIKAAARFGATAGAQYQAEFPDTWDQLAQLMKLGKMEARVIVDVLPEQAVRLIFVELDTRKEHVLFNTVARIDGQLIN